jgi:hypothetical protein
LSERTDAEHHDEGAGPGIGSEQPADQHAGDLQRAVGDFGPAVLDEALLAELTRSGTD